MDKQFLMLLSVAFLLSIVRAQSSLHLDYSHQGSILSQLYSSKPKTQPILPLDRLNDTFIPSNYNLELVVILDDDPEIGEQYTTPGKVSIRGSPSLPINRITLHSYLISVDRASAKVRNIAQPGQIIEVTGMTNDTRPGVQFLTLELNSTLETGNEYEIYLEFVAPIIQGEMYGLYLSTYTDPDTNATRRLAATQMESIHARKLFPCFDEPALKATFDVSIIRKDNYTSLANANMLSTSPDPLRPGWSIDKFNTTVPMSTYLFAMVVSDFPFTQADPSLFQGKPVKVYAEPRFIARGGGNYSARVGAEILEFYDEYFQAPYPLTKMDMASIPQFAPGAMENYGLNLYRESLLIYFPGEDLETSRNSITSVLAHELGHQNFGDWVTMNWWRQIWLNEGFATYVANLGVNAVAPEFEPLDDRIGQLQGSMVADASPDSQPLQNNVPDDNPDSHNGAITYDKGASINRMTEKFLTEQTFQKGLRLYLQDMKFKAAHSDDLFRNLDVAALEDSRLPPNLTVKSILDTWTIQRGHPLVRVSISDAFSIKITQEKYAHIDENPESLWYVPVTVVTEDKPTLENNVPQLWLPPTNVTTAWNADTSKWIMINHDATGYYRVLYDEALLNMIQNQLVANASVISPLSRAQLLDDYFTLAFKNMTSIESALNLTRYLAQETHFTGWNVIFNHLRKLYNLISMSPQSYSAFNSYLLPKLTSAVEKVGLEQSPSHIGQSAIYRSKLLDWACSMESTECFTYSQKLLSEWQSDPANNPITVDTQAMLECAIVSSGDQSAFDFIFSRYLNAPAGTPYRSRLLNSLSCASDQNVINQLLEKTLNTSSDLPRGDATSIIQRLGMNRASFGTVFTFLETRLEEIISSVGGGNPNPIASIVSSMSQYIASQENLDRLNQFIENNNVVLNPVLGSLQQSLNNIAGNMMWMEEYGNRMVNWLNTL